MTLPAPSKRQRAPMAAPLIAIHFIAGYRFGVIACRRSPRVSALHQDRPGALRPLAFAHDAEPLGNLGIGFEQAAEIAAETVLVELLVRLDVPQSAGIRRDLVRHD